VSDKRTEKYYSVQEKPYDRKKPTQASWEENLGLHLAIARLPLTCATRPQSRTSDLNFPCFQPREFDETKDFRLLSSAKRETGVILNLYNCNKSTIQWHISSFMQRMYSFHGNKRNYRYEIETIRDEFKMPKRTETIKRNLEEWMFNLIYPSHNGFPAEALHLVVFDMKTYECVLDDINAFANIIEKELVKCGRTVFVDEHDKVLLQLKYLQRKYPKLKFAISENVWPLKRSWVFVSEASNPILYRDIKTFRAFETGPFLSLS